MAYKDWGPEARGLFRQAIIEDDPETWRELDRSEREYTMFLFDLGFVNQRVSSPVRMEGRNNLWYELGIDPRDFDWDAWRRFMGYENAGE